MANIQPFDTGALSLRPPEEGINTIAGNARRVGSFYNQGAGALEGLAAADKNAFNSAGRAIGGGIQAAGDAYVNYLDHKEISAGGAAGTKLFAQLSDQWNKIASDPKLDPNDPSIKQKFMEQNLEPALQQFKDDSGFFTTEKSQDFAEHAVQQFRRQMDKDTSADMSKLADIALRRNIDTTTNSLSSMAFNDSSKLDFALSMAQHTIGGKIDSSPTLDATTKASLHSELGGEVAQKIFKSAAAGYIDKTGKMPPWINDPKYDGLANGAEIAQFQKQAERQAKTDAAQARAAVLQKKQIADQDMHAGSNKVINDNVTIDPQTGRPIINPNFYKQTLDLARKNPDAPSAASTVRTMLDWGESQQKKEDNVTNPETRVNLLQGMMNANKPTSLNDVLRAEIDGKLSNRDATIMKQMLASNEKGAFTDPVFAGVMASAKTQIEESLDGHERYGKFFYSFARDYQTKLAAGTLEPNALDPSDPSSMISKAMGPFKPTPSEKMQYHILKSVGGLPEGVTLPGAPKPGPSVAPPTKVSTPADADKLKPGTRYQTPDGRVYVR